MQCVATTRAGRPCANAAMHGAERCAAHLGRAVGPETALTDEITDRLVLMLRAGNYIDVACRAAGIAKATYHKWMALGRSQAPRHTAHRLFRERVQRASSEGETVNVAVIASAARSNWQAAAWLLERQAPERWGRVSVRARDGVAPLAVPEIATADDPFAEIDELAEVRRRKAVP